MKDIEFGLLVFISSLTGEAPWSLVKPEDVPEWITNDPDRVARLIEGECCRNDDEPEGLWYAAAKLDQDKPAFILPKLRRG